MADKAKRLWAGIMPLLAVAFLVPVQARASDTAIPAKSGDSEWLFLLSPFVWAPSMRGDASIGGVDAKVDVPFSEIVSNLQSVFMGNLEVTNRRLGFYLDGVYANTSQSEHVYGRKLGVGITQSTLAAGVYYRIYEQALGGLNIFSEPRTWRLEPTFGVRWTKLSAKLDVKSLAFSTKKKTHWTDPFVGLRVQADLDERWLVSAEGDVGGFDTDSKKTYNLQGYLGYRTFLLDNPTIFRLGYRALSQDYRVNDFAGGKFKYDVVQRGPVLGLSMRF